MFRINFSLQFLNALVTQSWSFTLQEEKQAVNLPSEILSSSWARLENENVLTIQVCV